jgi:hypothetical protein
METTFFVIIADLVPVMTMKYNVLFLFLTSVLTLAIGGGSRLSEGRAREAS